MIFNGYNVAPEAVCFVFLLLNIFLLSNTRPKRTEALIFLNIGLWCSLINIISSVVMVITMERTANPLDIRLHVLQVIFLGSYYGILSCLYMYVNAVSRIANRTGKLVDRLPFIALPLYVVSFAVLFYKNLLFEDNGAGGLNFTSYYHFYMIFAFATVLAIFVLAIVRIKTLPQVILNFIFVGLPADFLLLIVQYKFPKTIILPITYVMPFFLVYVVFHSILFDEYTGCQDKSAFETHYRKLHSSDKNKFWTAYVEFPRMRYTDRPDIIAQLSQVITSACRLVQLMSRGSRVYRINEYTFALLMNVRNEYRAQQNIDSVCFALENSLNNIVVDENYIDDFRMVVFREHPMVTSMAEVDRFIRYLFERLEFSGGNIYQANYDDYIECQRRWAIEKEIINIKDRGNLNDPRVLCYVQPIYDVKTKQFRSAESLMRLKIKGQVIYPDTFIPIAERNGCIHMLTKIMLNKVCAAINRMSDTYDFDAISVNVSTSEFADKDLHDEIMEIVNRNNINPKMLRLEMTESMMLEDYDSVYHNMVELTDAGIGFYLDDFGTGFSNFERIITMPFKTIKFDKSLLYKAYENKEVDLLVRSLVGVFIEQGLDALVEGVESQGQSDYSQEVGFEYIQGYLYSRPMPIDKFPTVLQARG